MVSVPERVELVLAANVKTTFVLPVPLWFAAERFSQLTFAVAIQAAVGEVRTSATLLVPAAGPTRSEVVPKVCACETLTANHASANPPPQKPGPK